MKNIVFSSVFKAFHFLDLIAPAQYWHDPLQAEKFREMSKYLAIINNDQDQKNETIKENLIQLENFVMIQWKNDTFIKPQVVYH